MLEAVARHQRIRRFVNVAADLYNRLLKALVKESPNDRVPDYSPTEQVAPW